jgi:hypothetical protein
MKNGGKIQIRHQCRDGGKEEDEDGTRCYQSAGARRGAWHNDGGRLELEGERDGGSAAGGCAMRCGSVAVRGNWEGGRGGEGMCENLQPIGPWAH